MVSAAVAPYAATPSAAAPTAAEPTAAAPTAADHSVIVMSNHNHRYRVESPPHAPEVQYFRPRFRKVPELPMADEESKYHDSLAPARQGSKTQNRE